MPNGQYIEQIMVADGDGVHPSTEDVKFESISTAPSVTGVKGNAESTYRTGEVNITQDNIISQSSTNTPSDSDVILTKEGNTWYQKAFSKVWDYVKSKIQASSNETVYGTCATAAATAAKVVTLQDANNWKLKKGTVIVVKFTNTNTAQNPTLNVNNSGAKSIYYNTAVITTGSLWTAGEANRFTSFMYDGTNWVWIGSSVDRNTTYSAMSKSELTTGTATTSRVVRADYLKQGIEEIIEDKDTNFEGTRSEWNALSTTEKAKYLTMDFTDDGGLGDISDEDVTFTSSDVVDANANSWTVVSPIASGTTLNTLFSRVSQMFKNVRYLYNALKQPILWSGSQGGVGSGSYSITLSQNYKNFKILRFYIYVSPTDNNSPDRRPILREVATEHITFIRNSGSGFTCSMCWGYYNFNDYLDIQPTSTDTVLNFSYKNTRLTKIEGVNV